MLFPHLLVCLARFGQQVHSLVLCEYTDSEESGDKDSQSCEVNTLNYTFKQSLGFKHSFATKILQLSCRYSLTEDGLAVAERLDSVEHVKKASTEVNRARNKGEDGEDGASAEVIDLTSSDDGPDKAQTSSEADNLINNGKNSQGTSGKPSVGRLLPGTYEIVLCVDVIETTG